MPEKFSCMHMLLCHVVQEMNEAEEVRRQEALLKFRRRKKSSPVWQWCKELEDGSVVCKYHGCGKVCGTSFDEAKRYTLVNFYRGLMRQRTVTVVV